MKKKKMFNKTLYWDIETEAKVRKVSNAVSKKHRSASRVVRALVRATPFDDMVFILREDIKNSDHIDLDRL